MVLKIRWERLGQHVHCAVFAGPFDGNLASCGRLVLAEKEFERFVGTLKLGAMEEATSGAFAFDSVIIEEIGNGFVEVTRG